MTSDIAEVDSAGRGWSSSLSGYWGWLIKINVDIKSGPLGDRIERGTLLSGRGDIAGSRI